MILLVVKWRGSINVASMRTFESLDALKAYVESGACRKHPGANGLGLNYFYAYHVFGDGTEARLLKKAEMQAVGLR